MPFLPGRKKRSATVPLPDVLGGDQDVTLPNVTLPTVPARLPAIAMQSTETLALSALIGANLFGRVGLSPALAKISDKTERGVVLNNAWRRYGTVNSLALLTLGATWLPARRSDLDGRWVRKGDRRMVFVKDVTLGAVAVTGVASAIGGVGFAHEAPPEGAVPMEDGSSTAEEAPPRASAIKRALNTAASLGLAAEIALVAVNASMHQRRTRRLLGR